MTINKPVTIVTIKNKIPLFKGEEQANAIKHSAKMNKIKKTSYIKVN